MYNLIQIWYVVKIGNFPVFSMYSKTKFFYCWEYQINKLKLVIRWRKQQSPPVLVELAPAFDFYKVIS